MKPGFDHITRICCALIFALVVTAGLAVAEDVKPRRTQDVKRDLDKTERELKKMADLNRKLESSEKDSSNSKRQKVIGDLRQHMADCIIRREDILGQEHTIKMHGQEVTSGTTKEAEAGAPVGTSRSKQAKNLNAMDGPNADRIRLLSRLQSLFVSAAKSERPAIEKQNDAFQRYSDKMTRFQEQLTQDRNALAAELDKRNEAAEDDEAMSEG